MVVLGLWNTHRHHEKELLHPWSDSYAWIMSMWKQAKAAISLLGITMDGLELINGVASYHDRPREALSTIRAIVVSIVEGFHGRITPDVLRGALAQLRADLEANEGMPSEHIAIRFRDALS